MLIWEQASIMHVFVQMELESELDISHHERVRAQNAHKGLLLHQRARRRSTTPGILAFRQTLPYSLYSCFLHQTWWSRSLRATLPKIRNGLDTYGPSYTWYSMAISNAFLIYTCMLTKLANPKKLYSTNRLCLSEPMCPGMLGRSGKMACLHIHTLLRPICE